MERNDEKVLSLNEELLEREEIGRSQRFKLTDKEKRNMLICLLLSNMMCGVVIYLVNSFYPLYV